MRTTVHVTSSSPRALIRLAGDIDLLVRDRLCELLLRLRSEGCTDLVVDLDDVTFIDAHSLGMLDEERRRLERVGGALRVVAASEACRRVADLAGYGRLRPPAAAPSPRGRRHVTLRAGLRSDAPRV